MYTETAYLAGTMETPAGIFDYCSNVIVEFIGDKISGLILLPTCNEFGMEDETEEFIQGDELIAMLSGGTFDGITYNVRLVYD